MGNTSTAPAAHVKDSRQSYVCNDVDRLETELRDVISFANDALNTLGRIRNYGVSPVRLQNFSAHVETMRLCLDTIERDATHAICTSGLPTQADVLAAPHSTREAVA